MKLRLREKATLRDGPVYGTGRTVQYEAEGLPAGKQVLIANFGGPNKPKWQVMQIKNGAGGEWTGDYASAEEALASQCGD